MTTPKKTGSKGKSAKRARRAALGRTGPIRTGAKLAQAEEAPQDAPMSDTAQADASKINQSVADAVKNANDVLSETIAQGRIAAEQLRQGNYNMRDVPVDVEIMGMRMIKLARELSETTLNVCEQLLRQLTKKAAAPLPGTPGKVPPFPTSKSKATDAPPSTHAGSPTEPARDANTLALMVEFEPEGKAVVHPAPLIRPDKPTTPYQIFATPLQHISDHGAPIEGVEFQADLGGSLIARITIPADQPPGVYSGMIIADTQQVPLGVLSIEVMG
jgi:hypothetical protein